MRLVSSTIGCLLCMLMTASATAKVNVFTCEPEWKALVEVLGGEYVKAYSATTAFQDPHHIEARPSLIARTRRADLVVCTGAELEIGWLPVLIRQSGNAKVQEGEIGFFLAAEQVDRIEVPTKLDRSLGDVHASGNPHVLWDPYRLLTIAKALAVRLQEVDSEHATQYQKRYLDFEAEWKKKISEWETKAASLKDKSVIVYHKNWSYLLGWLGIGLAGDIEPKPGLPPTGSHLAELTELTRRSKADYILLTNYQDDRGAKWLSGKTGIPILKLPYTVGGHDRANDLVSLYDEVINVLVKGV